MQESKKVAFATPDDKVQPEIKLDKAVCSSDVSMVCLHGELFTVTKF